MVPKMTGVGSTRKRPPRGGRHHTRRWLVRAAFLAVIVVLWIMGPPGPACRLCSGKRGKVSASRRRFSRRSARSSSSVQPVRRPVPGPIGLCPGSSTAGADTREGSGGESGARTQWVSGRVIGPYGVLQITTFVPRLVWRILKMRPMTHSRGEAGVGRRRISTHWPVRALPCSKCSCAMVSLFRCDVRLRANSEDERCRRWWPRAD